jgi:hypothetical protein
LSPNRRIKVLNKAIIALTAAIALGCVPMATDALAASQPKGHAGGGHTAGGHAMGGHAMAGDARGGHGARYGRHYEGGAPIYDSYGGRGYYEGGAPIYDSSGGQGYYEGGAPIYDSYGGQGYYEGGAPIYDSCSDGSYGTGYGCRGYGVPFVGGVINGIFGGYAPPY